MGWHAERDGVDLSGVCPSKGSGEQMPVYEQPCTAHAGFWTLRAQIFNALMLWTRPELFTAQIAPLGSVQPVRQKCGVIVSQLVLWCNGQHSGL